jgi:hypothetical protein
VFNQLDMIVNRLTAMMIQRYFPFLLVLIMFSIVSCKKEKTSWNSDWHVPVVDDTLDLSNLVNDSTLNVTGGFYNVDLTRTLFDIGIQDIVKLPDTTINHSFVSAVQSLNVPPGFSFVNEIEEHELNVEEVQLKKIRVSGGTIDIKVYNPLGTKAFFTVQLPGATKNGVAFQEQYVVEAGSVQNPASKTATISLAGYDIDLTGINGGGFNLLQSQLIINSDPLGPSVTITNSQVFNVEANFKNITVDYARGYFGNQVLEETKLLPLDVMNAIIAGSVDLPETSVTFEIENGMKLGAKATLVSLQNTNSSGNTVQLVASQLGTPVFLDPATGSWSGLSSSSKSIVFNGTNSNLESYLENLGNEHEVGYKLELNPWGNISGGWDEIFPNSRLRVKVKAQLPLALGANGLTVCDTFDLDLEQKSDRSRINSGKITLDATNAFPFSCGVTLHLMDANNNVLHVVQAENELLSAIYGSLDPLDGLMKKASQVVFNLSESAVNDINQIKKVVVLAQFNTPDAAGMNQQVQIPAGAFLAVKLRAAFEFKAML